MISAPIGTNRYQCRWYDSSVQEDGNPAHYWVDHRPEEPHWPDSAVMRWDLRQADWHKIWPELIDHPCALLFAPRHPGREGAPIFRDWVASWPEGFRWEKVLPEHLRPAILKAKAELSLAAQSAASNSPNPQSDSTPDGVTPTSSLEAENVLEQLSFILLEVADDRRHAIGQHLATLALAPDSGRIIQALKLAFKK